jgi:hypothetical protein
VGPERRDRAREPPGRAREPIGRARRAQPAAVLELERLEEVARRGVDRREGDVAALALVIGLGDGELRGQVADEDVEQLGA